MTWVLIRSTSMTKCVLIIYAFVEKNKYNFLVKLSLKCLELFFFENIFETQINSLTSLGPLRHNCMNQSEPFMLLVLTILDIYAKYSFQGPNRIVQGMNL